MPRLRLRPGHAPSESKMPLEPWDPTAPPSKRRCRRCTRSKRKATQGRRCATRVSPLIPAWRDLDSAPPCRTAAPCATARNARIQAATIHPTPRVAAPTASDTPAAATSAGIKRLRSPASRRSRPRRPDKVLSSDRTRAPCLAMAQGPAVRPQAPEPPPQRRPAREPRRCESSPSGPAACPER